ncbi:MAG: hypothetical protein ACXWP6_14580 [Ktedonobacterales bacterium]
MDKQEHGTHTPPPMSRSICSLVVARDGLLALIVGGRERWREVDGYTFIPAELPGGELRSEAAGETLPQAVAAIARRWLGCDATLVPGEAMYGPSARHAIDRLALAADGDAPAPLPLLQLERGMPLDEESAGNTGTRDSGSLPPFSRVVVRAYRATLTDEAQPGAGTAGLLWLAPRALRVALLGVPLADLLAQPSVEWQAAPHVSLPDDVFIFVPADYGERHLLRIAAKYGPSKLGLTVTAGG